MNEKYQRYDLESAQKEAVRIKKRAEAIAGENKTTNTDYRMANSDIDQENKLRQGKKSSEMFSGKSKFEAVTLLYSESAEIISNVVKAQLSDKSKQYDFADFGSFKGELMNEVLNLLPGYNFNTIAIDSPQALKDNNVADQRIGADMAGGIPLPDNSVDVGMMRYVLQWNKFEMQERILKECARIINDFFVIQHAGADNVDTVDWRDAMGNLLNGVIPQIERTNYFFSSSHELGEIMKKNDIPYRIIKERKVKSVSDVFIQRYSLDDQESQQSREILGEKDYIIQTTFLVLPNLAD